MSDLPRIDGFIERLDRAPTGNGPLDGLTFGLKDIYDLAGRITGCGNPRWKETHPPAETDCAVVSTLLGAGARLTGITHTDEIAYSLNGENAHYGTPENAAAPARIPGGSSSGSASVTAAGKVDFAIGSDTGGSVRIPASYCGLYGLRTTHGMVPLTGVMPLAPSYDTAGWFARDPAILRRVGDVLLPPSGENNRPTVRNSWHFLTDPGLFNLCEPETAQELRNKAGSLLANAEIVDLMFDAEQSKEAFRVLQAGEIWETHGDWVTNTKPEFGPGVAERFQMARQIDHGEREEMGNHRRALAEQLHGLLGENGCLVLPTAPGPAPLAGTDPASLDVFRYRILALTSLAGHAGLPQITIPVGSVGDAPVGISVIGPAASDLSLLHLVETLASG